MRSLDQFVTRSQPFAVYTVELFIWSDFITERISPKMSCEKFALYAGVLSIAAILVAYFLDNGDKSDGEG